MASEHRLWWDEVGCAQGPVSSSLAQSLHQQPEWRRAEGPSLPMGSGTAVPTPLAP